MPILTTNNTVEKTPNWYSISQLFLSGFLVFSINKGNKKGSELRLGKI